MADFVADLMDEGAGGRDALELAGAVEALGAALGVRSGWEALQVEMEVLRPRLGEALGLMADVVARPDFPPAEIERKREELLTDLARARDEARIIAGNAFSSLVFGARHPYGRLPNRDAAAAFTREEMISFHDAFVRPDGATLVLVGDVSAAVAQPIVERAFGGWPSGTLRPPAAPAAPATPATTIYLVDKPGAPQSEIRIGHPGVARDDPDYFPVLVLNTVLGGSFTSRLNSNLREEHGYSYGARSSFTMLRGAGPFQASAAVVSEKTDSSVVEFFRELERMRAEPVPQAELERAKNYLALGLPRRFETAGGVAGQLADLAVYDIGEAFYADYVDRVMAVTAADVQRVARERIGPDRSVVVVVGDRATVEEGLRGLDLGRVEIRPVEEFVR
jgi:predicted Zn-dependent peptidase